MKTSCKIALCVLALSPLLLCSHPSRGQTPSGARGIISGTVRDKGTNDPLPGANVIVDGTTIGAASDLQGNFVIRAVPAGTYRVRASIIGYLPAVLSGVKVVAGDTVRLDFTLAQTAIDIPEVVVTATRKAQSFMETPVSVSVVTAQQIRQQNFVTLDQTLEFTPGVNMMGGQINIRGSSGYSRGAGTRVLLLVDGVPMLPGDSGDIKWDALPPNEIDRVEVVKGASSSLYGSNALGGVINVITKDPTDRPVTAIRLTTAIYDEPYYKEWKWTDRTLHYNHQDISHSRSIGKLKVRGALGRRESTGYSQNGHYHRFSGFGKAKYQFTPTAFVTAYANYARDRHGEAIAWKSDNDPYEVPDNATGDVTTSTKLQIGGTFRTLLSRKVTLRLRDSFYRNGFDNELAEVTASSFCTIATDTIHVRANKNDLEAQLDLELSPGHAMTLGATATLNDIDATLYGKHEGLDFAGYIQHEWKPAATLSATASLRYDHHRVDTGLRENQFNPRVGLVYQASPRFSLHLSSGRGFRAATMAELFTCTRASGFTVIPNPELKSETAWSNELGAQFISSNIHVKSAVFWNEYQNLIEGDITLVEDPRSPGDSVLVIQFQNFNRARIRGAELEINAVFWKKRLTCGLSYTYLDARELERLNSQTGAIEKVDEPLAYRARHLLSGNVTFTLGRFYAGIDSRYVSRIEKVRIFEEDARVSQKVTNLRVGVKLRPLELTVNVYNVFQYNYTQVERKMEPIRSFALTTALNL